MSEEVKQEGTFKIKSKPKIYSSQPCTQSFLPLWKNSMRSPEIEAVIKKLYHVYLLKVKYYCQI